MCELYFSQITHPLLILSWLEVLAFSLCLVFLLSIVVTCIPAHCRVGRYLVVFYLFTWHFCLTSLIFRSWCLIFAITFHSLSFHFFLLLYFPFIGCPRFLRWSAIKYSDKMQLMQERVYFSLQSHVIVHHCNENLDSKNLREMVTSHL